MEHHDSMIQAKSFWRITEWHRLCAPCQGADVVDPEAWFNIFVLHQNRVQRGSTHHVTESMLPSWLDFVIWGHEHECRIDLEGGTDGPVITQPGSSVATSMTEGESKGGVVSDGIRDQPTLGSCES